MEQGWEGEREKERGKRGRKEGRVKEEGRGSKEGYNRRGLSKEGRDE